MGSASLVLFARLSGLVIAVLVVYWALLLVPHQGLTYSTLHPLVIGFILVSGEAILIHSWLPGLISNLSDGSVCTYRCLHPCRSIVKESGEGDSVSWSSSQINAYFGLSGGYNLLSLVDHFHSRGLYRSIFLSIMEGEESLSQFSPELVVQNPSLKHIVARLPPIIMFHGTADYSIPSDESKSFAETFQILGGKVEVILYEGKNTHGFVSSGIKWQVRNV